MNKKGFTLIELLAVIVILAIIALIATPIVLNIIEDSKKSAFVQTANGIVDAAEYYYMKEMSDGAKPTKNKVFTFNGSTTGLEGLEFDGEVPKEGTITVDVNGNIELVVHNNQYCITKGYNENEVSINDYNGVCEIPIEPICSLVNDTDNSGTVTAGDKYQCKVKDNMETEWKDGYYFYVLSYNEESGTINLILDRNVYYKADSDTGLTTEINTGIVQWYAAAQDNSFGPVTAMDYLYNATKDWNNIPNIVMNYGDEGNTKNYGYGSIVTTTGDITTITKKDGVAVTVLTDQPGYTNLKARLPYYSEIEAYSASKGNQYLYDNLKYECYDNISDKNLVPCDEAGYIEGLDAEGISHIDGVLGYWTLCSSADFEWGAWVARYDGNLRDYSNIYYVNNNSFWGVRPVIEILKSNLS